jgi:hypothetical protein
MIDKIKITAKLSSDEIEHLSQHHHLACAYDKDYNKIMYMGTGFSNFSGIKIFINGNNLNLKTSLYKLWNKRNKDIPQKEIVFSITNAKTELKMLLDDNHLNPNRVFVKQYSFGLNLNVSHEPFTFIDKVKSIKTLNPKEMFIDAYFPFNTQKTTSKHKDIRKFYAICDESNKMKSVKYISDLPANKDSKILRIESFYRRHNIRADLFIKDKNIDRIVDKFYYDWSSLNFFRYIKGYKGSKGSELEMARNIIDSSPEIYLQRTKEEFRNNEITDTQYRTIREFIRDFDCNKNKYKIIISAQETEYKNLLFNALCMARN